LMLASAFVARQAWGALADRIGGLRTILAGSSFQAVAIVGFLLTQDEAGLFAVAAAFGLGFSGIIPAYSVAIRDLFPSAEASWRMPLTLFTAMGGMAFGSWFAGLLYDHYGYYAPAFGIGVIFNLINLGLIGFLVSRTGGVRRWLWPAMALSPSAPGVKPPRPCARLWPVGRDLGLAGEGKRHLVQALEQRVAADAIDMEADLAAARGGDGALVQIDDESGLAVGARPGRRLELGRDHQHLGARQLDRQHAVLEAVVEEDRPEGGRDD